MSGTEVEQQNIINGLKKISKIKKITYGDISKKTEIPESTLRKIFSGRDCKLSVLLKICDALEVDLNDVMRESEKHHGDGTFKLNQRQSEYFMINLDAYWMLLKLIRKMPLDKLLVDFGGDEYRFNTCLLYTSPSPRDATLSRMPSSA